MAGVFSDLEIRSALERGQIIIEPFVEAHLNGSSYDVTLGNYFYVTDKIENQPGYDPFDEVDVKRYFGNWKRALPAKDWSEKHKGLTFKSVPKTHPIIVLQPHERILAHTHEFIGIKPPGTSVMHARSTWGRNGVVVYKDAGWGDPGYINRWTMEIQNDNEEPVPLPVGERIAQITFFHTGPVGEDYRKTGKYQSGIEVMEIIASWKPSQMLPRAFKDQRRLPVPIDGLRDDFSVNVD